MLLSSCHRPCIHCLQHQHPLKTLQELSFVDLNHDWQVRTHCCPACRCQAGITQQHSSSQQAATALGDSSTPSMVNASATPCSPASTVVAAAAGRQLATGRMLQQAGSWQVAGCCLISRMLGTGTRAAPLLLYCAQPSSCAWQQQLPDNSIGHTLFKGDGCGLARHSSMFLFNPQHTTAATAGPASMHHMMPAVHTCRLYAFACDAYAQYTGATSLLTSA